MEAPKMSKVCYSSFMHNKAYINGQFVTAASGKTFEVRNPANRDLLGCTPDMDVSDAQVAIDAAYDAFQTWQNTTAKERALVLRKWFELCEKYKEDLAMIITKESGKPLAESIGEMTYGSSFIELYAEEGKRVNGEVVQSPSPSKEMIFIRKPIGVAAMITPWNFPNAMITRKAAAAMAAGCTCVVKPAEDTPYSAIALADLSQQAGIPSGVFNVVTSSKANAADIGTLLCTSPKVAGLSFTGSTAVGKLLYKQCSEGIKRIGLELGGNAPFIVFDSADLSKAVNGLMAAKFRNTGQTCISANRILVQSKIYDKFVELVKETMQKQIVVGDGAEKGVTFGPLINESQLHKVENLVKSSLDSGAKLLLGGKRHEKGGLYYEPTIIEDCAEHTPCFAEEIFGPVVCLRKFESEEEALAIANSTNSGLAGYFFSENLSQVWRVAHKLETGMVGINDGMISAAEGCFGGIKESGIGREGSHHGMDEYTYFKYLCFGGLN
ncbi:succinic semialdehyde dehydrogenase isoform X2 [Oratosquilla oratoria]